MIHLGDCKTALQSITRRDAFICDPPAGIRFMREWDALPAPTREWSPGWMHPSADLRELQREEGFVRYWAERFGMMNDLTVDDGVAIVWALPRTQHLTQAALRYAGWKVPFVFDHIFGQGWNKNGGHLKPGHESWLIATKGHYELGIEACRIPRGAVQASAGGVGGYGGSDAVYVPGTGAKHHSNGAHPIDVGLSHCEECVRVGERKVKATGRKDNRGTLHGGAKIDPRQSIRDDVWEGFGAETALMYQCLAGCSCGRSWLAMAGGAVPRCECGEQAQWACPVAALDEQSGNRPGMSGGGKHRNGSKGGMFGAIDCEKAYGDSGGAHRFFHNFAYFAKASGRTDEQGVPSGERHAGCENLFWRANKKNPFGFDRVTREEFDALPPPPKATHRPEGTDLQPLLKGISARGNVHPTVKSIALMMHLVKLAGALNPRDEPFRVGDLTVGSGSTAIACQLLSARQHGTLVVTTDNMVAKKTVDLSGPVIEFDGAEMCPEAIEIANARLAFWAGITPQTLESFILTGDMPGQASADARQRSLFG